LVFGFFVLVMVCYLREKLHLSPGFQRNAPAPSQSCKPESRRERAWFTGTGGVNSRHSGNQSFWEMIYKIAHLVND
jgi:hypothetical protein